MSTQNIIVVKIYFNGETINLRNIFQLLKDFKQEGVNLSLEKIDQQPVEYIDYSPEGETRNLIGKEDIKRKNTLILSGNQESIFFLKKYLKSGKLSIKLGVKVLNLLSYINLNKWFEGVFYSGFQSLSNLRSEKKEFAYNLRNFSLDKAISGGTIIDLGLIVNNQKVVLIINASLREGDKRNILVQLYPSGTDKFLAPNIKLLMLTTRDRVLQEVESSDFDEYIQLLPFKNKIGKSFTLQIIFKEEVLSENIFII